MDDLRGILRELVIPQPRAVVEPLYQGVEQVFGQAAALGWLYEEIVREWHLPTARAAEEAAKSASKHLPEIVRHPTQ
jgi:hypothetical protein